MPTGRPSDYSPQLAIAICARIADGESVKRVTSEEGMPTRTTVYEWLAKYPAFADMYARAKEDSADIDAEEIKEIADDLSEDPQSRRVRIDARKWIASKLKPKKYGERLELAGELNVGLSDRMRTALTTGPDDVSASEAK